MNDRTQEELIKLAKAGRRDAFEELIIPYLPMLLAYCRTICGDFHLAQDAVQQTALIAFQKLHLYFELADFAGWLRAIARLEALTARRKRGVAFQLVGEELMERAFDEPAPEREALGKCLEALGRHEERSAQIVRAHYFDGSPLAAIADTMSLNLNTVKTLLHRARLTLGECVKRRMKEGFAI